MRLLFLSSHVWPEGGLRRVSVVPVLHECRPIGPDVVWKSAFLWAEVRVLFGHVCLQELVTELVSRHLVVTCYRVVSDLLPTCNPRFWPKNAI